MNNSKLARNGNLIIGFTYNVEKKPSEGEAIDKYAEFDSPDTIEHIQSALETSKHKVIPIEADRNALDILVNTKLDVIFNIAEGLQNNVDRESIFPAIFEFLGIPYVGSDPLCLAITLDKPAAKKVWLLNGIPTAGFQIIEKIEDLEDCNLSFPILVKPSHEGTSKGIFNDSYVENKKALREQVEKTLREYQQPVIIEEFIEGREFTVTVIGNKEPYEVLPPVEISFEGLPEQAKHFCSYEVKTIWDDPKSTVCPANITPEQEKKLQMTALNAYKAVKVRDFGRVDMRLDKNDNPYVIEINPLPGMSYS
ncbi:MAG TPA: ATP-grasp domain-containing protein, partial [Candidatus Deferrimicrobium sp.]|nr:ATP-grasp domain-containing protein [Candidatus Deferrimicrobium sp.]